MKPTRTIAEGSYLGLYERDGWEFAQRPNVQGVVGILALTPSSELVLIEQFRRPVDASVIEIPAGLVGDEQEHLGESPANTARRELLEETGYEAQSLELLLSTPTSAGMTPEITHLFLARGLQLVAEGGGVGNENICVHHVPLAEVRTWLQSRQQAGALVDSKIHAALWLAGYCDGELGPR